MSPFRYRSTRLDSRLAVFAMAVAGMLATLSGNSVQAGVILPWVDEARAVVVDHAAEGCESRRQPELPAANDSAPSDRDDRQGRETLVASLLSSGGGASAPVNGASGQTSLLLAVIFQLPEIAQLLACTSRHLQERYLQLPQPPRGELLDPPKS